MVKTSSRWMQGHAPCEELGWRPAREWVFSQSPIITTIWKVICEHKPMVKTLVALTTSIPFSEGDKPPLPKSVFSFPRWGHTFSFRDLSKSQNNSLVQVLGEHKPMVKNNISCDDTIVILFRVLVSFCTPPINQDGVMNCSCNLSHYITQDYWQYCTVLGSDRDEYCDCGWLNAVKCVQKYIVA